MDVNSLVGTVFSGLSALVVEDVADGGDAIVVTARTRGVAVPCPVCGSPTAKAHGYHRRTVADVPVDGRQVVVHLRVRRLACPILGCRRQTFREQIPGLLECHQRRTVRLAGQVSQVARELCGRAATRLAGLLAMPVSRSTALRHLQRLPLPRREVPRVIAVDDFALKRRHRYATIMTNAETGERIDVLSDRTAETLEKWLREHPGAEVVCRDGSATYAEAVRRALPDAVQFSDRWRLWRNLCDKVQLEIRAHAGCWATINPSRPGGMREQTTRERWNKIHDLLGQGVGLLECARRLSLALNTVKRYARMPEPQALRLPPPTGRPSSTPTATTFANDAGPTPPSPSPTCCARSGTWATPAAPICWSATSAKAAPKATDPSPRRVTPAASSLPTPKTCVRRKRPCWRRSPRPARR